jgi:transcriptional regulator with XRE-family HTH domain
MQENDFLRTEIGKLLRKAREKSGLSQTEVAKRIRLSAKTGHAYISRLESGKVKNPPLLIALLCLRACGESWPEFFKQLDTIDFKMRHEKMISQVQPPPTQRKIQRDAMKYEIGVEFPSKEKEEIDFDRLKKQIKDKVTALVNKADITLTSILSHQGRGGKEKAYSKSIATSHSERSKESVLTSYQKFALEYFEFLATLNKPGMKMVADKWQRAGLKLNYLFKIKKIINSVLRGEIKRIESKKPLPTEKQEKMAIGFTKYRIKIERIEAEVHKVLCELGVGTTWFALYKDFARECYRSLKRYYGKEMLSEKLKEIIRRWVKEGLKEDVLLKVKEATIKVVEGK